ncbi:hypothetical protein GCM10010168_93390 [Actinoplanes ianthinogenes]|uniref:Uncharacterized protein n=1 Tax=Actinoplanes ianthinogenes TaxID=122358 RepID=A0ABM7LKM9_9ACTN|nr:hypothetical protein Aiant_04450 [Actinoplanes ianthinogenes]GGR59922.1 hypothetical protein GCM10010168_93390 [Actinoplanes ianthinogenes]
MAHFRGSVDRTVAHMARRQATTHPPGQLIAAIRAMAGSRRHTLGVTYLVTRRRPGSARPDARPAADHRGPPGRTPRAVRRRRARAHGSAAGLMTPPVPDHLPG